MRARAALCGWVLVLGCAADEGSNGRAAAFSARDSAGVSLVRNAGGPDSLLRLVEELRLGTRDGPTHLQFYRIRDIAISDVGRLYIANSGSHEVRVFERDGRYVRTFGRGGQGPGEFELMFGLHLLGDTLLVRDAALQRLALYDTAGTLIGMAATQIGGLSLSLHGRSREGWIVTVSDHSRPWPYRVGVPFRDTVRFALLPGIAAQGLDTDAAFGGLQPLLQIPTRRVYGIQAPGTMTANSPLWEPQPAYAADRAGRLHVSHGSSYTIDTWELYPSGARLVRRLTREHTPVPVTTTLIERYFDQATTYFDTVTNRGHEFEIGEAAQTGRRSLPHAEVLPAIGRIRVARDGALWVERPDLVPDPLALEWSRIPPQPTRWDIFDADGRFSGTVELPPRFRIYSVTAHSAVGVLPDELDVEHVVRWTLQPGG